MAGCGAGAGVGAVALRGLAPGRASRAVPAAALLAAAALADADQRPIYVDLDAEGFLVARGGGLRAGADAAAAAAALAARARPGAGAELEPAAGGWRVVLRAPAAPHAELRLWPRADLLARAGVPALQPHHKLESGEYACHLCSARFEAPQPLSAHLFLGCRAPAPGLFYAALLRRLEAKSAAATAPAPAALTRVPPAQLEALATAWGRGAGAGAGHACLYCGRLYSRRYGLKIHLRTHTGYKPLRCPHCRRAFGDPSNLNKHVKLHAAGAGGAGGAHGCALCGKALARRRDLERHMRARHDTSLSNLPQGRPTRTNSLKKNGLLDTPLSLNR